jgi:hypothetical protein
MRTNRSDLPFGCTLTALVLAAAGIFGWVANIVSLARSISDPLTAMHLLRVLGIPFWPLGCVLGYF